MNQEVISGKTFVEENYPIHDIGQGVISKGQAIRHYEKMHPEHTVVSISSFKLNHQDETINIRVQVKPKIKVAVDFASGESKPVVALLNPGYGELLAENAKLKAELVKQHEIADGLTAIIANATGADEDVVNLVDLSPEDAKEVIEEGDSMPLSEFYDGLTGSEDDPGE